MSTDTWAKTRPIYHSGASQFPASEPPRRISTHPGTPRGAGTLLSRATPPRARDGAARRLNKCMMLEFDAVARRWNEVPLGAGATPVQLPQRARPLAAPAPTAAAHARSTDIISWYEHPLTLALLMTLCPPVGVTLVWTAPRIPQSGRVALTAFGFAMMCLAAVVACLSIL